MRRLTVAAALVALAGCASPGSPPGGPPDVQPPLLLAIKPDTNAVNIRGRWLELRFDDIINERVGGGSLASYFVISPATSAVEVKWHRERLEVGLRRGWRRNTTYSVMMLPGLTDLRSNADSARHTFVFSTGPALDVSSMRGMLFDWVAGRPAANAVIRAVQLPDSVPYLTQTDSIGGFELRHIPAGRYLLQGIIDQNRNRLLDPRESFDSVTVTVRDSISREMLAFVHDTIGPMIATVTPLDSVVLRITFDKPLDTALRVTPAMFSVKSRDSTAVAIAAALRGPDYDRQAADSQKAQIARDSIKRANAADSARRAAGAPPPAVAAAPRRPPEPRDTLPPPPKPSVASPITEIVLRLAAPLKSATSYRVSATDMRNLLRVARSSERVFTTAKAAAADSVPRRPTPGPPH